ncbi:AbrB family transcriptional regulator [Streptomyces sp. NPDC097617]|uniref:AbrB family transcriptional regulator n=1 Tax=Streptomyces sp. NPDC097617 TaxID=3366091 RepID=UPI003826B27F
MWNVVSGPDQDIGLLLLAMIAFTGLRLGQWVHPPSPGLLGPMLVRPPSPSAAPRPASPPPDHCAPPFTAVGLDIGLRFTRPAVTRTRRLLTLTSPPPNQLQRALEADTRGPAPATTQSGEVTRQRQRARPRPSNPPTPGRHRRARTPEARREVSRIG